MTRVLILALLVVLLTLPALAGDGRARNGSLDMTIFFDYEEDDFEPWREWARQASRILSTATGNHFRLGQIRMTRARSAANTADIRIQQHVPGRNGRAFAMGVNVKNVTGLGKRDSYLVMFSNQDGEPRTLVHELGHYVFQVYDEYSGRRWRLQKGQWVPQYTTRSGKRTVWFDGTGNQATNPWYCTQPGTGGVSCFMDSSQSWKPGRTGFCSTNVHPPHTVSNRIGRDDFYRTTQQAMRGETCWTNINRLRAQSASSGREAEAAADGDPQFVTGDDSLFVLLLETSGETAGVLQRQVDAAEALLATIDDSPTERLFLAVAAYGDTPRTLLAPTRMDAAGKAAARAALQGLAASGTPRLGAALDHARSVMDGFAHPDGAAWAIRRVTLLAGGTSADDSLAAARTLEGADIQVDAVGVVPGVDPTLLSEVAELTGGTFRAGGTAFDLISRVLERFAESGGAGLVTTVDGTVGPGSPASHTVPVDVFTKEIAFAFVAEAPALVALAPPGGPALDLDDPPAGVTVARTEELTLVTVANPQTGDWTASATSSAARPYSLLAFAHDPGLSIDVGMDPDEVGFPRPLRIEARVDAAGPVAGCQVSAQVERPDGTTASLALFDDGSALHGDLVPDDGVYANYVADLPASGGYSATITVRNVDGRYAESPLASEPGDTPLPGDPVPPFTRVDLAEGEAVNVPAGGGTAVIAPGNLVHTALAPGVSLLEWENPDGQTVVQRSTQPDAGYIEVAVLPAGVDEYRDVTLGAQGSLFYRVVARVPGVGDSAPSPFEEVDATIFGGDEYTPTGGAPGGNAGGCFVATAAYGTDLDPRLDTLRRFRDRTLLATAPGQAFVETYYAWSPPAAAWIAQRPLARAAVRGALAPVLLALEHPAALWLLLALLLPRPRRRR